MDVLRASACLMVIILHVVGDSIYEAWTSQTAVLVFWDTLARGVVPVFLMLSGAFSKSTDIKKYLKKAAYYFLLFVVFKIVFDFLDCLIFGSGISVASLLRQGITDLTMSKYHLWFLPEFVVVMLVAPLINAAVKHIKNADIYLSSLFIIFNVAVNTTSILLPTGKEINIADSIFGVLPLHMSLGIGYFCIGKAIYNHITDNKDKIKNTRFILVLTGSFWLVLKALACIATIAKSSAVDGFDSSLTENNGVLTLLSSVLLFVFFSILATTKTSGSNGIVHKAVEKFVPCILCIYLIHPFFIDILTKIGFKPLTFNPVISVPVKTVLVLLICIPVALIVNAVKKLFRPRIL